MSKVDRYRQTDRQADRRTYIHACVYIPYPQYNTPNYPCSFLIWNLHRLRKVVTYCSTVLATTLPATLLQLLATVQGLSLQELRETKKKEDIVSSGVLTGQ